MDATNANPVTLMNISNTPRPIQEGDAGIVIGKDGNFFVFNTHDNFDPDNMTVRQLHQGKILQAFSVAMRLPQIMAVLLQIADDPAIVSKDIDFGTAH